MAKHCAYKKEDSRPFATSLHDSIVTDQLSKESTSAFMARSALLLLLTTVATALDTSPPCVKNCYDTNPSPRWCEGIDNISAEILSRCTCSSFMEGPPLLTCLQGCPNDQLTIYISGIDDLCFEDFFPGVKSGTNPTITAANGDILSTSAASGGMAASSATDTSLPSDIASIFSSFESAVSSITAQATGVTATTATPTPAQTSNAARAGASLPPLIMEGVAAVLAGLL